MKQKTKIKAMSWLLSLAMVLSLLPGLSLTARAAAVREVWSEDKSFTAAGEFTAPLGVDVTADITLTIDQGVTLTVNGGIDASGHTLTVAGKGTLVVNGANGGNGTDHNPTAGMYNGTSGSNGGNGFKGNIIIDGCSVVINGGRGGNGGSGETSGGAGGNGGSGVSGNVTVKSGSVAITGGNGGNGGTILMGGNGSNGASGKAVTGTITGIAEESDDGSTWTAVSGTTSGKRYVKVEPPHTHSFTYTASGATITATCSAEGCDLPEVGGNRTATLTIKPPANLVYDGKAKAATVENNINSDELTITYTKNNAEVEAENVIGKGDYTASITLTNVKTGENQTGNVSASVNFTITDPTYTITIPATLPVKNAGWNATAGITASGAIAEGTRLTVTAESANEWKLKDGNNTVGYYLATAEGGEQVTAWSFTAEELAADNGATKDMGAVVEDYVNAPEGNYEDTVTFTAEVESPKTLTIMDTYTDINDETQTYSITFEYYESETWEDLVDRYDELSTKDFPPAPDGYVIRILKADVQSPVSGELQIKSSESQYTWNLVSIKDKVSKYSAGSYSFHESE